MYVDMGLARLRGGTMLLSFHWETRYIPIVSIQVIIYKKKSQTGYVHDDFRVIGSRKC